MKWLMVVSLYSGEPTGYPEGRDALADTVFLDRWEKVVESSDPFLAVMELEKDLQMPHSSLTSSVDPMNPLVSHYSWMEGDADSHFIAHAEVTPYYPIMVQGE